MQLSSLKKSSACPLNSSIRSGTSKSTLPSNVTQLEPVAPQFGEVVGLGLREMAQCPVEVEPDAQASLTRQRFNSSTPSLSPGESGVRGRGGVFAVGWFRFPKLRPWSGMAFQG